MKQPLGLAEMSSVFTLVLIVIVGILLRRLHALSAQDTTSIRKLVFNIALPALVFISLYSNPIPLKALWIILGVIIIQAIGYLTFPLVPAMALALTLVLPVAGDIRSAFILQSAMPSLVVGVVYGAEIGLDVKKLSQNIVVSTLLFPLTILFWGRFL